MNRLSAFVLVLLAACDSSSDDRPMSSLGRAEINEVCTDAIQSTSQAELRAAARVACVINMEDEGECRSEQLDACVEELLRDVPEQYCDFDDKAFASTSSCDAPVQLLIDCIDDSQAQVLRFRDITCETEPGEDPFPDPASCEALYDECGLPQGLLGNQVHTVGESEG